jgi:RNA polymerase sigma-70 factor (ECF subfamily)
VDAEAVIRAHWDAGDVDEATTAALQEYGQEVFSFLVSRMRNEDRAADVFSQASEDLWKTMAKFEWRCSMRTWLYKLARNAAVRYERSPANRSDRRTNLSRMSQLIDKVRTRTLAHLRTEVKDEFQRLREKLDPTEQTLLILRIDRGLDWNDVARVMSDSEDGELDDEELKKTSARLRQRFQKLKTRLRELAQEQGLLDVADT